MPADEQKVLHIKWMRLVSQGETCPRCGSTEMNLNSAVEILKNVMAPLNISIHYEKGTLSLLEFKKNATESNRIWINTIPLEEYIGASNGESACCGVCEDLNCRTVEVNGTVYNEIPTNMIIRAALIAASRMLL